MWRLSEPIAFCCYRTSIKSILIINPIKYPHLFFPCTSFFHYLLRHRFLYLSHSVFFTELHSTDYFADLFVDVFWLLFCCRGVILVCICCVPFSSLSALFSFECIYRIELQHIKIEWQISGNDSNEIVLRISCS